MKRVAIIVVGAALAGAAYLTFGTGSVEPDGIVLRDGDPEIVALGAEVYIANCASCHGAELEGQPDWRIAGPEGRLPAPPHDETGHTWHHDSETLFNLTKYGVGKMIDDPDYASDMPVYEDILTDNDIIAVLSFIKSTWPQQIRARHDEMTAQR